MIRSICFDLGGVIIGSFATPMLDRAHELFEEPIPRIRAAMNIHEAAMERGEIDHLVFWKRVADELGTAVPQGAERLFIDPWLEHAKIDHTMLAYIDTLRERFIIGCISNTQEPHVSMLRERGLLERFEPCVLSCEEGVRKPEKDIFERYCTRARVAPHEVLFVDDQPENLKTPQEMGMQTILFEGIDSVGETISSFEH